MNRPSEAAPTPRSVKPRRCRARRSARPISTARGSGSNRSLTIRPALREGEAFGRVYERPRAAHHPFGWSWSGIRDALRRIAALSRPRSAVANGRSPEASGVALRPDRERIVNAQEMGACKNALRVLVSGYVLCGIGRGSIGREGTGEGSPFQSCTVGSGGQLASRGGVAVKALLEGDEVRLSIEMQRPRGTDVRSERCAFEGLFR